MAALQLAISSFENFIRIAITGKLHHGASELGRHYLADDGHVYRVFRQTFADTDSQTPSVVEFGFRLRLIGASRTLHWLFQRLSILTTPFWSGISGFAMKLWMVDRDCNYLGMYQWQGAGTASSYIAFLTKILLPLSVRNTVWSKQYPNVSLTDFLAQHRTSPH